MRKWWESYWIGSHFTLFLCRQHTMCNVHCTCWFYFSPTVDIDNMLIAHSFSIDSNQVRSDGVVLCFNVCTSGHNFQSFLNVTIPLNREMFPVYHWIFLKPLGSHRVYSKSIKKSIFPNGYEFIQSSLNNPLVNRTIFQIQNISIIWIFTVQLSNLAIRNQP